MSLELQRRVLQHFANTRTWLPLRTAERLIGEAAAPVADRLAPWGLEVRHPDVVAFSLQGLVAFPDGRELLRPLIRLIPTLIDRYLELRPDEMHSPPTVLRIADFEATWGNASGALTAAWLLHTLHARPFRAGGYNPEDPRSVSFVAGIDCLKFRGVADLEQWLILQPHDERLTSLTASHVELLRRIHRHVLAHGDWPLSIPFAIAEQEVGFVPEMATALSGRYIRNGFGYHASSRLDLTPDVVALVDQDGAVRRLITQALQFRRDRWKNSDSKFVPLQELAEQISQPIEFVRGGLRYVEHEAILGLSLGSESPEQWQIALERAQPERQFDSWDAYWQARELERQQQREQDQRYAEIESELFRRERDAVSEVDRRREQRERRRRLREDYRRLVGLESATAQNRGLQLNRLIAELLQTYGMQAEPSVRGIGEIGVAFKLRDLRVLLEAKWTGEPIERGPVSKLRDRVEERLGTVLGVMISMGGYLPDALAGATVGDRRIVLLEQSHLEAMLFERIDAGDLLAQVIDRASFMADFHPALDDLERIGAPVTD